MLRTARYFALLGPLAVALAGCPEEMTPVVDGSRVDSGISDGSISMMDGGIDRCAAGADTDNDGIDNATECMLGSDPNNPDSDMDGIRDGAEARYPRICVADDPMRQRRCVGGSSADAGADGGGGDGGAPCVLPACTMDSECMSGERCRGLNPGSNDSDGDGVPDRDEDLNGDGIIDVAGGETDPRLGDTDGDGRPDSMSGVAICRPDGLAMVRVQAGPMTAFQVGHDPAWGMARTLMGAANRGAILLDDPATNVSAIVAGGPATGDVRAESARVEMAVQAALGAGTTAVLVGRALTTHEMFPAVQSTYRVARMTSASALRDGLTMALVGAAAPAGGPMVGAASEFIVDVTTVLRNMRFVDIIVAVAPRAQVDNPMINTAIRMNDLTNATGVSELGKNVGFACQVIRAEQGTAPVDFIWTIDTSGSMGPYQEAVGRTATRFVERMATAGVDFRVAAFQANSNTPMLTMASAGTGWPMGFRWINGRDMNSAAQLCQYATVGTCPTAMPDTARPFTWTGGTTSEQPTAGSIATHFEFRRRGMAGETNPEWRLRAGAKVVAFHVTDEPGSNDFAFFRTGVDPQTMMRFSATGVWDMATLNNIVAYYRRNEILTFGLVPRLLNEQPMDTRMPPACSAFDVSYLPRCVIEANRGAYIPLRQISAASPAAVRMAFEADVDAAMSRIVDAIAGAASQFVLNRSPITSTIKVRVRGMDVPRNRAEGFDYDPASRSIIFFGNRFRPMRGDEVVISYRVWEGSLG